MENESHGLMLIKTGLKLIGMVAMCLFIMFGLAFIVYDITFNSELMLLAFMGGFFIGMLIFVFTYPIVFKSYKVYWDNKQKEKELLCQEKEVQIDLDESKETIAETAESNEEKNNE